LTQRNKRCNSSLKKMTAKNGKLAHSYRAGKLGVDFAFLDDYSFLSWGLIELYQATEKKKYLDQAEILTDEMIKMFWDEDGAGFYFTSKESEPLLVRIKESYDAAIPSGNSAALLTLTRLAELTRKTEYSSKAEELMLAFAGAIHSSLSSHSLFLLFLFASDNFLDSQERKKQV